MICEIDYDIMERKHILVLMNDDASQAYTIEFKAHRMEEGTIIPVTKLEKNVGESFFEAMAKALQQRGQIPQSAVDAELKATKYHLEDMRLLGGVISERK